MEGQTPRRALALVLARAQEHRAERLEEGELAAAEKDSPAAVTPAIRSGKPASGGGSRSERISLTGQFCRGSSRHGRAVRVD
jgi:hypothetical protein